MPRWRVKPVAGGVVTPPVTDISLSASTIVDNAAAGTVVGTLSNNLGVSVSWSITDNTKFQLSASTGTTVDLQRSSTGSLTAGVSETVTIRATRTGTAPYDEPFSVSVSSASETLLGYLTMTNATAGAGTSVPFHTTWPAAPAQIGASDNLRVYDDNGSGGQGSVLANFQVDNLSTDMNADERLYVLSGVVPSLGSSATRLLHVYKSTTAPPTGTAITEADLFATSWRLVVSFNIGGTTYSIDTDDLEGASSTWSKTAAVRHDDWMNGPGTTCFVYSSPPFDGVTPHASGDGLRVWFHIYARKATTAAVSGGNPILTVECDVVIRNMDATRVSPANYWYGLQIERATSLSSGTLITTDQTDFDGNVTRMVYARSQPAATLTATGATSTGFKTWTRGSGTWDTDILGAHIVNAGGAGKAYVTTRTNGTTIEVYVYETFTTTSYTSGNWTVEGVGHWYGGTWHIPVIVGVTPIAPVLWGNNASAVTPTTLAALDFLASTEIVENYGFAFSDLTNEPEVLSPTRLDAMRADSAIRPFTLTGPQTYYMGDMVTDVGRGGNRLDIGIMTGFSLGGLASYTALGRRKIRENAMYWYTATFNGIRRYSGSPAAGSLGVVPRPDCGTNYMFGTAYTGTEMPLPASTWDPWQNDTAHAPCTAYPAYLVSGRLIWLDSLQETAYWSASVSLNTAYSGDGILKTPTGDASNTTTGATADVPLNITQQRSVAWSLRDLAVAVIATPDASKPTIYNAKSMWTTWMANTWSRGQFGNTGYTDNGTAAKNFYAASGPRYAGYWFATNNSQFAMYQVSYMAWTINFAYDLGLVDSNADSFSTWFAEGSIGAYTSSDVAPDYMTTAYWVPRMTEPGSGTASYCQTWAETYQSFALYPPGYDPSQTEVMNRRNPTTVALSAVSGGSITATFTGGPFGQTSWYAGSGGYQPGGWCVYGSAGVSGKGQITAVSTSNVCTLSTLVTGGATFTTSSPTPSAFWIPAPHPLDAGADGTLVQPAHSYYMQLYRRACVGWQDRGVASAADCVTYITTVTSWPSTIGIQLWVDPR
jgi:hypothetical protein